MMIASGLGRSKPFLRVPTWWLPRVNRDRGGASCGSGRVRNAPSATLGHRSATCRDRPRLCEKSEVQFARRSSVSILVDLKTKQRWQQEGNRENNSAQSWLAHIFTQPGPERDICSATKAARFIR